MWIENNAAVVVLGLAALLLTLLALRSDQAVAGLVAVTVLAFWLLYFLVDATCTSVQGSSARSG